MKTIIAIALAFFAQDAMCQTISYLPYTTQFKDYDKDPYNVPTPNQSSLGTYGIIPVSPYTGKADISIPLYSTTQRDVALNILLTYDTSGLLINQLPGWTGHNWTLNAGGAITRKINGRPDEISYRNTNAGRDIFFQYNKDDVYVMTNGQYWTYSDLINEGKDAEYDYKISLISDIDNQTVLTYQAYTNYFSSSENIPSQSNITDLNYFDRSADIFYFNFMGISGSFFYGNDGKWKVRSDQNIHVLFDVNDSTNYMTPLEETYWFGPNNGLLTVWQPKTIKGFTLIDEHGNKYIFGGDKNCIEYSMSLTGKNIVNTTEPWSAVSWTLKEVQDRFGNILYTFKYSRGTRFVQFQNSSCQADRIAKPSNYVPNTLDAGKAHSATINAPVYLDSISVADGTKIIFNHSRIYNCNVWSKLFPNLTTEDIYKIEEASYPRLTYQPDNPLNIKYDELAGQYKNFVMTWDSCYYYVRNMDLEKLTDIHFIGANTQNVNNDNYFYTLVYDYTNRMHLTSVICSNGSTYSNAYSYDLEYDRFDSIPSDYLTKKFDLWGYYNGIEYDAVSSNSLWSQIDSYLDRLNISGNVPNLPNTRYGTMGMLKKITYPTGGYSVLEYEQNTCSSYMKDDKSDTTDLRVNIPVGGLRIKSVCNYDNGGLVGKKTYTYTKNDGQLSSGELSSQPKFHYHWEDATYYYDMIIYNSVIPLANSFSPIVGYSNVRETELDGSYTTYNYSNCSTEKDDMFIDSSFPNAITPFDEFCSRQYMCGKILEEAKLKSNGDSLQHIIYTYASDASFNNSYFVKTTSFFIHPIYLTIGSCYKMYYFRPGITSVITKTKYGNSWVKDEITYNREHKNLAISNQQYADVWNVLSETRKRGSNQLRTEYRYPYHNTGINNNLVQQFYLPVTSVKHYLDNNLIDGSKTVYRNAGKIVPDYDIVFASDSTKCDTVAKYVSYSSTYRITEMLDRNRVSHKYYWNNRDQLIGAVTNGSINVNGANTDINTIMSNNASVIYASKPTDALLYEYNNQGKVSKTVGGNGMSASYNYDLFGRLTNIKDTYGSTTNRYTYNYVNQTDSIFAQQLTHCYMNANLIENTRNVRIEYAFPYTTSEAEITIKSRLMPFSVKYSCLLPTDTTEGEIIVDMGNQTGFYNIYYRVDGNLIEIKQLNVF